MKEIQLHDRVFRLYLPYERIQERIAEMADALYRQLGKEEVPVFIPVLKGAFLFGADFFKAYPGLGEIDFIKASSYEATESTGDLMIHHQPVEAALRGRTIVLLEGVVDTGLTLHHLIRHLEKLTNRIFVVALFNKQQKRRFEIPLTLVGFEIPALFIVGYGMDYNNLGRNLKDVYVLKD